MKRYLFAAAILFLLQGCADTLTNTDVQESEYQIKINKPVENDTIGYRGTQIDYTLTSAASINFLELYVNDNFIENIPPVNNQKPVVSISLDSSYEGKKVELYLVFYGKNGTSFKSNIVKNLFVSGDRTLPSRPFNVKLIRVSSNILNISWEDNSPYMQEYEIWRREGLNGTFVKYLSASGSARNINDENAPETSTYYYKIRGISKNGTSDYSDIISSTGSGGSPEVPAPGNLKASVKDLKVVLLTWQDNSTNENYFKIERRLEWTAFEAIGYAPKDAVTFTDSANGLSGGYEYYYRIKAISDKDSSWSNEAYLLLPTYILKAPQILTVTNSSSRHVVLTWKDNDQNYADFIIERKIQGSNYINVGTTAGNIYTYSDNVEPGNNYVYRIRQDDGTYSSPFSAEESINTQIIPLPAPQNATGYFDGNAMVLSWQFTSDADNFIIERRDSTAGTSYTQAGIADSQEREFRDYSTVCQHIYVYRIKAVDPYMSSPYSSEKSLKNWNICP